MSGDAAVLLLVKVSVLLAAGLVCLQVMKNASAALRHLICVCALAGALVLLLIPAPTASVAIPVRIASGAIASGVSVPANRLPAIEWVMALWLSGTGLLLLRILIGHARMARIRSGSRLSDRVENVPVRTADIPVPMVSGLMRPAILLPAAWPSSQRAAAIQHELAHIRRNDLWSNLLAHVACAIYWFHPLAWIVAARLRDEQENACDDAVIESGFAPDDYAEALLGAARNLQVRFLFGCPMITNSTLKSRIAHLLDGRLPRNSSRAVLRATAMSFAVALAVIALLQPIRAEEVHKVGGDVVAPKVTYKVEPDYTPEAKAAGVQGSVVLSVVIGANGLPRDIVVLQSLDQGLDNKAVEAVSQWRFSPATKKGEPVAAKADIQINFRLQ